MNEWHSGLSEFGNPRWAPSPNSALPPSFSIPRLALKLFRREPAISKFVLEFLRYPHLIPALFNVRGFGPPVRFTAPSTWTWVDPHGFGSTTTYSFALFETRFRCGSVSSTTSHAIVTRRFILQKARYHPLTGSNLL